MKKKDNLNKQQYLIFCTHNRFLMQSRYVERRFVGCLPHELVRKEGRNTLVVQVLTGVCHMETHVNKEVYSHMNFRTHKKRGEISLEKITFLDTSHDQCDECFTDAEET